MASEKRPNILLIMSDQHNRRIAGCYGDPVVQTPNLDALAGRGVVFENAYCNYPLCAPSRMCFMSGREPYELGAWMNQYTLPTSVPTFAHALGQAGYEVVLCGRMHFNGPDQRHGFQKRIFPEVGGPSVGQLVHTNQFVRTSMEKSGPGRNHYLLYDRDCAEAARRFLEDYAYGGDEKPLCLVVGFVGPHCPFVCPEREFEKYFDAVSVPTYTPEYLDGRHPYSRRYAKSSLIDDLTEHEIRRTRAAYYGMIDFDDQQVGAILGTLEETGLAEDTAVIYTSDHGDLAGEHGLWWKMSLYEGSAGVPLIASWPGHFPEGRREAMPVTLADLAPTLADLGGAPEIPGVRLEGFADALRSGRGDPDRAVFSELIGDSVPLPNGPSGGPSRMMRRGDWKCNYYHGEPPELFNLAEDPDEMVNRAGDPACRAVLNGMLAEILREWDPEKVEGELREQRRVFDYIRAAPADPTSLAGERWRGPRNYGSVNPV